MSNFQRQQRRKRFAAFIESACEVILILAVISVTCILATL